MGLTVNRSIILNALSAAGLCLESKGTIPALAFAMLELNTAKLMITGTDLDVTYQTVIEAEGDSFSAGVPAKELTRLVSLFEGEVVSFSLNEKGERVTITCDKSKYTLPALRRDAFPNIDDVQGKHFLISGLMLKRMLERTVFCVSTEESRYNMQGVLLETQGGKLSVAATDGYRLAVVRYGIPFSEAVSGVIPARAARALVKALDDEDPVAVTVGTDGAKFTQGDTVLRARLLVGQFPRYEMILPSQRKHAVSISTSSANVFKRSAVVADVINVSGAPGIYFNVSKDGIEVTSRKADQGEGTEFITSPCETLNGDSIPLHFASKYLTDMLAHEPEVTLAFDDNNSQFLLTPTGLREYEYKYVLMPCRI